MFKRYNIDKYLIIPLILIFEALMVYGIYHDLGGIPDNPVQLVCYVLLSILTIGTANIGLIYIVGGIGVACSYDINIDSSRGG